MIYTGWTGCITGVLASAAAGMGIITSAGIGAIAALGGLVGGMIYYKLRNR